MDPVELADGDLLLRPWRADDAPAMRRACQDPEIQRWTTVPKPYLLQHAERFTGVLSEQRWADGSAALFGVFDAATGELLGSNGLVSIDRLRASAEIGYWTAPWARGRGVAARSSRTIAEWAFKELELRRLVWQAMLGNHASRLAALRTGFRIEGRLRLADTKPGEIDEGWLGSLLPSDLAAEPPVPDSTVVRRAKLFGGDPPVLRTQAPGGPITLRRSSYRDIDAMVAMCRDPEAVRWTSVPDPYDRANAEWFLTFIADHWAAGTGALFGVYDASDTYCGSMDLRLSSADPDAADVGYLMAPGMRDKGYATAALRAMCEWSFSAFGLARIEWRAQVGNLASRRVAEKAGFTVEGVQRAALAHRGARKDTWVGSLLRTDL